MSQYDQTKKTVAETVEKGKAVAEQSARSVEQSYSAAIDNVREYNRRMIDIVQANSEAAFEFARQLAAAKTPSDIMELWTLHAQKHFEMLSEQTKELAAIGQKMASDSAQPIARGFGQALKKAS